jgi:hypothetical protein
MAVPMEAADFRMSPAMKGSNIRRAPERSWGDTYEGLVNANEEHHSAESGRPKQAGTEDTGMNVDRIFNLRR